MSLGIEKRERFTFFTLSKDERNRLVEKILDFLKKYRDIIFIVFFGSFVTDRSFRDIDIGLYLIGEYDFLEYKFTMEKKIRDIVDYPIDVKILNYAPPWFIKRILEKDILYYEKIEGLLFKIYKKALDELYLVDLFQKVSAN